MSDVPFLQGPRIVMEPVSLRHVPSLQRYFADWKVIEHLSTGVPWPYPDDGVFMFIRDTLLPGVAAGRLMAWAIVPKSGPHEAIGLLEWRCDPDATDHRGFWLGAEWWGHGLMTEAVMLFQDYVFLELEVERLFLHNSLQNPASGRVKEKTGARRLDIVDVPHHDGTNACQRWELTRQAWAAFRGLEPSG